MKRVALALTVVLIAGLAWAQSGTQVDLANATIADLNAAFNNGTLTAETLTEMYLARIAAYDKQGPTINAVITLNPKALSEARALDAERKAGKVRGPLHGIPIVLKDNFNTSDLPTTGGSQLLEGSIPPSDAFVVRKLRDAGAIVLAKANLSEFASGGGSVIGARDPPSSRRARSPRASARWAARRATLTILRAGLAPPAAEPARRSPPCSRSSDSAPIPPARSAARPPRMAWWA